MNFKKEIFGLRLLIAMIPLSATKLYSQVIVQNYYSTSQMTKQVIEPSRDPTINNNGSVTVTMPIAGIDFGNRINIPISLNYNTQGIKVSQRPSIIGLGWNLEYGGVVSRVPKGRIDEHKHMIDYIYYPFGDGIYTERTNFEANYDVSYVNNCTKLNRNDWNTTYKDEIANSTGYTFPGVVYPQYNWDYFVNIDLAPDEFNFSVGDLSGNFFLNHEGNWISNANRPIKIQVIQQNNLPVPSGSYSVPRAIATIIITDDRGNKYYFGKNGNSSNAIEFNRGRESFVFYDSRSAINEIAPISWYLSKIESATGDIATYTYTNIIQFSGRNNTWYNYQSYNGPNGSGISNIFKKNNTDITVTNLPIIQKIETGKGVEINFITSNADDLTFRNDPLFSNEGTPPNSLGDALSFFNYLDLYGLTTENRLKLDEINIKYNNDLVQKVQFEYINNPSERLKLQSLNTFGNGSVIGQKIKFDYNLTKLPSYLSGKEDRYGFYNGVFYFENFQANSTFTLQELTNNYIPTRDANIAFATAEILNKVTYPTGGTVEYEYQLNTYSGSIPSNTHTPSYFGTPKNGYGLRVSKITSKADANSVPFVVNYSYIKDYATNPSPFLSSGIQASEDNIYLTSFTSGGTYFLATAHVIGSVIKREESSITYSEITKIYTNNGFIVDKFSNYDNGFIDYNSYQENAYRVLGAYDNRKSTRGKVMTEEVYNNNTIPTLLKKTTYSYYHDISSLLNPIRTLQYAKTNGVAGIQYTCYPQYAYYDYLVSKETLSYPIGSTIAIREFQKYYYDNASGKQLTKIESANSDNSISIVENKYPIDYINTPTSVITEMLNRNVISEPIDIYRKIKKGTNPAIELKRNHFEYQLYTNSFIVPQSLSQSVSGGALENLAQYASYDPKGNLIQKTGRDGITISSLWDYNSTYLVAEIQNAEQSDIAYTSFEADSKGNFSFSGSIIPETGAPTGVKVYSLTTGSITKQVNPSKTYILSLWANNASTTVNGASAIKTGSTMGVYTYYEYLVTNASTVTVNGSGNIDELRLYPTGALMTTFTYLPLIGKSSQCDANNSVMYYEYDAFGRLSFLKDQDKNIVKAYEYHFKN